MKFWLKLFGILLLLILAIYFVTGYLPKDRFVDLDQEEEMLIEPTYIYGFNKDSVEIFEGTIRKNEFLSNLLGEFGVPFSTVYKLSENAKDIFPVNELRSGKPFAVISKDSCAPPAYFVYKPDAYRYIRYNLDDDQSVEIIHKQVDTVVNTGSGIIDGSLWVTMQKQGMSPALIDRMEDALAWSVDFYHIQKGDRFKLIYDTYYIDGEYVGVGKLHAALFESGEKDHYSFHFRSEKYDGYFDEEGRPMRRAFLKSPVKYGRISSRYNLRRFHPIRKRTMPHYGTDYAAPRGTPILAVSNGTVTKASYTRNNGKYVKLRHDKRIETQYLHMSRIKKDIKPGVKVKQGEVIGYVGSTGLATGPHVCFRFWKDGKQVNHLRENLPPPDPMHESELPAFYEVRDRLKSQVDQLAYPSEEKIPLETDSAYTVVPDSTMLSYSN
jgi:murein DD-endopeptidase MepM/ murein hydrolase activator NlpD